jgi:hypothetical protein
VMTMTPDSGDNLVGLRHCGGNFQITWAEMIQGPWSVWSAEAVCGACIVKQGRYRWGCKLVIGPGNHFSVHLTTLRYNAEIILTLSGNYRRCQCGSYS